MVDDEEVATHWENVDGLSQVNSPGVQGPAREDGVGVEVDMEDVGGEEKEEGRAASVVSVPGDTDEDRVVAGGDDDDDDENIEAVLVDVL